MQLYFDVILILLMSSVVALTSPAILYIKTLYNTDLQNHNARSKNTTVFIPVSVGLHKYTKMLFFGIFQEKAVGFLESEKFKYYAFVKRSDSPLYILLMCQSFVSLT